MIIVVTTWCFLFKIMLSDILVIIASRLTLFNGEPLELLGNSIRQLFHFSLRINAPISPVIASSPVSLVNADDADSSIRLPLLKSLTRLVKYSALHSYSLTEYRYLPAGALFTFS